MSDSERKSSPGIKDIGTFVENYERLLDKLFPVFAVWDAAVYVARWENYLLTLGVMLALSFLLYFPSILLSWLTLSAILVMGVGRYHGQTKAVVALRRPPAVELLDSNQQALKKQYSEQKHMHKLRVEYRQILSNTESHIVTASKFLDYVNRIYLWKSPEVSLCVTVLLCVLLILLCTVSLHAIGAALPIVLLCTNKYFFARSVDIFKQSVIRLQLRLKNMRRKRNQPKLIENDHHRQKEGEIEMEPPTASDSDVVLQNTAKASEESSVDVSDTASGHIEAQRPMPPELRHRADRTHPQPQASVEHLANSGAGGEGANSGESVALEGEGTAGHTGGVGSSGTPQLHKKDATPLEYCNNCQASFAKLLKRKHVCSNCGQSFCGSCTVKVKRAVLGATSPAAFEESVRVCLTCKTVLDRHWADSSTGENSSTVRK